MANLKVFGAMFVVAGTLAGCGWFGMGGDDTDTGAGGAYSYGNSPISWFDGRTIPTAGMGGGGQMMDQGGGQMDQGGGQMMDQGGGQMDQGGGQMMDQSGGQMDQGGGQMDQGGEQMDQGGAQMDEGGTQTEEGTGGEGQTTQ